MIMYNSKVARAHAEELYEEPNDEVLKISQKQTSSMQKSRSMKSIIKKNQKSLNKYTTSRPMYINYVKMNKQLYEPWREMKDEEHVLPLIVDPSKDSIITSSNLFEYMYVIFAILKNSKNFLTFCQLS